MKFADSSLISLILTFFKKDSGIYLRIWRNLSQILKLTADNGPVTAVSRRELRRELGGSWRENVNVNWVKLNVNLVYHGSPTDECGDEVMECRGVLSVRFCVFVEVFVSLWMFVGVCGCSFVRSFVVCVSR